MGIEGYNFEHPDVSSLRGLIKSVSMRTDYYRKFRIRRFGNNYWFDERKGFNKLMARVLSPASYVWYFGLYLP